MRALVLVGTTEFDDLIRESDRLAPFLSLRGVAQIGHGRYLPRNMQYFRFAPDLARFYDGASLVISHGGLGITMEALSRGIPLVSVSNPDRYDNHQEELLSTLAVRKQLIWCRRPADLEKCVKAALTFRFAKYSKPECSIPLVIRRFLSE